MSFTTRIIKIFLPFVVGYFATSYYRTMSAVFAPFIQSELSISSTMMSLLTAIYFLTFALMQIPAGVLSDHFGPRRTQSSLFFIGGIGSILFGFATGPTLLFVGRILLGIGMSGGLMIAFSANHIWFNKEELPLLNSLSFAFGSLGAIASSLPTQMLLEKYSWQSITIAAGIITIGIATLILFVVPDPKRLAKHINIKKKISGLRVIFKDRYYWKVAPLVATSLGVLLSMQSYWISPWLEKTNNSSHKTIAIFLLVIAILLIFSVPFASLLSTIFSRFKTRMEWIIGIGALISITSQILITLQILPASFILWGIFAFFSFFPMLGYTAIALHFPSEYSGRSTTCVNLLAFSITFLLQYLFGLVAVLSIVIAFWVYIIIQLCALIWFCFGKTGEYA